MTELRKKMIERLQLRGFPERTQEAYTRAVRQLGVPGEISIFVTIAASIFSRSTKSKELRLGGLSPRRKKRQIRRVQTIVRNELSSYGNKNQNFSRNAALRYSALFVSGHLYRNFGQRAHQRTPNRSPNATGPVIPAIIGELKEKVTLA